MSVEPVPPEQASKLVTQNTLACLPPETPEVVRLAGKANEREREREYRCLYVTVYPCVLSRHRRLFTGSDQVYC